MSISVSMDMSAQPTLVVMAAGMGSRYGGLKQLDSFGPLGETIIEYSVYDAMRAGFGKIVFVIRKSIEQEFRAHFDAKFSNKLAIHYVYQELDLLPDDMQVPPGRVKPWGTGQAVWVTAPVIREPFAVINSDDFYGPHTFRVMADYLKSIPSHEINHYCLMGYPIANTLSVHGAVSRGICEVDENGFVISVMERTQIMQTKTGIVYKNPDGEEAPIAGNAIVSMNMMGFTPSIFDFCRIYFKQFLEEKGHHPKAEFYLPMLVNQLIQSGKIRVKLLTTPEKWFGVTYPEDKPFVVENLAALSGSGLYPGKLWD